MCQALFQSLENSGGGWARGEEPGKKKNLCPQKVYILVGETDKVYSMTDGDILYEEKIKQRRKSRITDRALAREGIIYKLVSDI